MSKAFQIAALAGDGIGPEVMSEAIKVLRAVEKKFGLTLKITEAPVGWAGIDAAGKALPDATLALCKQSDAVLFGSVGLPDRDPTIPKEERPERAALLRLRKEFGLFANLRPVVLSKALAHACPLQPERQGDGIDILVVRELTGGMYFGQPKLTENLEAGGKRAIDTMVYTTAEIERIARQIVDLPPDGDGNHLRRERDEKPRRPIARERRMAERGKAMNGCGRIR